MTVSIFVTFLLKIVISNTGLLAWQEALNEMQMLYSEPFSESRKQQYLTPGPSDFVLF